MLDSLLPEGDIAEAFAEFAPHTALWDFTRRDLIVPLVDRYAAMYPDRDPFAARVGAAGTGGWATVPAGREPHAYGANVIALERPDSGQFHVSIDVESLGSLGTPVDMRVTVVRETERGIDYAPVWLEARSRAAPVSLPESEPFAYLVVAATGDTRSPDETFSYRFQIEPGPEPDPGPDEGGCSAAGHRGGAGGALLLLLAWVVPFRRPAHRRR